MHDHVRVAAIASECTSIVRHLQSLTIKTCGQFWDTLYTNPEQIYNFSKETQILEKSVNDELNHIIRTIALCPPTVMSTNASSKDVAENRQRLSKMLQYHGYSACREALVLLEDHFTSSNKYESMEDFISKLNIAITFNIDSSSSIIDPELADSTIKRLNKAYQQQTTGDHENNALINIEPELPVTLDVRIKNVECDTSAGADRTRDNGNLGDDFIIHYNFLFKRLSNLQAFTQGDFQLTRVETLNATSKSHVPCICFGLLIKDTSKIDRYMLIDSTGRVPVSITADTTFKHHLAYTNCIVLIEGVYINSPEKGSDYLLAVNIGLPPTLLDPLPDKSLACVDDKLVIILKELYLDEDYVCEALDMLFTGYNSLEDPPLCFILIGDFTREPCDEQTFGKHMRKLVRILRTCDNLKNCHFVFVPGQRDTAIHNSQDTVTANQKTYLNMPRPPLTTKHINTHLLHLSKFDNIHLATNPAHIYLGERLISVVSHSYFKVLKNHLLHDLSDQREELFETARQIILSNAHFSAGISKVYRRSMNLWHRPDLLVLADTEAFGNKYDYSGSKSADTSFATIPSFARQYSQFKVYYIKSGEIEDSQVSADAVEEIEEVVEAEEDVQQVNSELD